MGKKKKQKQARPVITDVSAVKTADAKYVTSRSYAETSDLLSEGEIDGLVSGNYQYMGNEGETGYTQVVLDLYTATGIDGDQTITADDNDSQMLQLGFLRSVYWNDVPVVDKDGYYNFQSVNIHQVVGGPIGTRPQLAGSDTMDNYTGMTGEDVLDLSIQRSIGERLYGPEVASGEGEFPTDERIAQLKAGTKIDKYSKTYTILNKECSKIQVNIKINALFENLQAGPKTYKKAAQLAAEGDASSGYGDTKARTIQYAIFYQPVFDQRFQGVSVGTSDEIELDKTTMSPQQWLGPITERVTGKIDQGYIRTTTINLSKEDLADTSFFEGWRIRIVRLTPESLTSFLRNVSFVDSIVEIYGTQLRYPYSSMMYSQFDARSFSRIPARSYDTRLLKIKVPDNYDPETKTYGRSDHTVPFPKATFDTRSRRTTGSDPWRFTVRPPQVFWSKIVCATSPDSQWSGKFKTAVFPVADAGQEAPVESDEEIYVKEWCDNPAWCFYDILTNPRYGLGEYINEDDVDKWALYEIGQYCDVLVPDGYGGIEPRFSFNYIITSREEAFKVVNDLASAFRGIAYYANGSIMAVQDKFKKPLTQFTTSNVVNGDFNYASSAKKARHTVAIVRYNDKRNLFQPAVEYVEDEEAVRRYGIREIETSALGCTSKGQARRFAKWILASEANETETVSFSVGMEGAYLNPGDVVQIYDNFRHPFKYSGRTNRVEPYVPNTSISENANWQDEDTVEPVFGPNFDVITVDQAISFKTDKLYKLDLLTPTYDYPTGTIDLNSSDKISRNQIQTLLFSGAHTKTITGSFRSDYLVSGSGVCTQIFFNTGGFFGGFGNQFDFTNYVITGYTNSDIQGKYTDAPINESYSGGCFSGQNLIWSSEPSSSNDDEFVSGNSSEYRVINISEDDGNSYSVSALAYSTGKYDDVESAIEFEGKNVTKLPMFPTGNVPGRQATIDTVAKLVYPFPQAAQSVDSTALNLESSEAFPTGHDGIAYANIKEVPMLDRYTTLKVTFSPAGFESAQVNLDEEDYSKAINTDIKAEESLNYAICISRDANFDLAPTPLGEVDASSRVPFAVSHSNWRMFETGVELYIPGKTAGSTSKYGTYEISAGENRGEKKFKIQKYSAEFLLYEPDITKYHVAVFALSKEGVISDGILSKIIIERPKDWAQSFSIANAITISNLTTESIDNPAKKTTMHAIESMEPTFGWSTSFVSIFNELKDPDTSLTDEPWYKLNIAQNVIDYRITIRAPSDTVILSNGTEIKGGSNIPSNTIYVELTGFTPAALTPDFAFKSTYNDPNIVTGLRIEASTQVGADVTIWDGTSVDPPTQITSSKYLDEIQDGVQYPEHFIRNEPSGYIVTNNDAVFPLREYDIVVEAHDQYGKTSSRNEVWSNTIGNDEKESNWIGSTSKYDILGVIVEPPSGLIFATKGTFAANPFSTDWMSTSQAYAEHYPYVAKAAMYPNGFIDIMLQHSRGTGPDAGNTRSTDQELEKFFNNIAGLIYYFTTGDNAMAFNDEAEIQTLTKAEKFTVSLKAQQGDGTVADPLTYKIDNDLNKEAGFVGTPANEFFGGIIDNANKLPDNPNYKIQRGYYLLSDSDTVDNLHIPVPVVSEPDVENIQLVIGFFDELSLLRGFESDGTTAKLDGKDGSTEKKTPKIFTDKDIYLSTVPLDFTTPLSEGRSSLEPYGTSLFLGESSIMGAGDIALAFRGWAELTFNTAYMGPANDNFGEDQGKGTGPWGTRAIRGKTGTFEQNKFIDLEMGVPTQTYLTINDGLTAGPVLSSEECVFKNLPYGNGFTAQYKMERPFEYMGGGLLKAYKELPTKFWIRIILDQNRIPFTSDKFTVFPDIDLGIDMAGSTKITKPQGEEGSLLIDFFIGQSYDTVRYERSSGHEARTFIKPQRKMPPWVPPKIKIRFGVLATNE